MQAFHSRLVRAVRVVAGQAPGGGSEVDIRKVFAFEGNDAAAAAPAPAMSHGCLHCKAVLPEATRRKGFHFCSKRHEELYIREMQEEVWNRLRRLNGETRATAHPRQEQQGPSDLRIALHVQNLDSTVIAPKPGRQKAVVCAFCGKVLGFENKWRGRHYCSEEHEELHQLQESDRAVERLRTMFAMASRPSERVWQSASTTYCAGFHAFASEPKGGIFVPRRIPLLEQPVATVRRPETGMGPGLAEAGLGQFGQRPELAPCYLPPGAQDRAHGVFPASTERERTDPAPKMPLIGRRETAPEEPAQWGLLATRQHPVTESAVAASIVTPFGELPPGAGPQIPGRTVRNRIRERLAIGVWIDEDLVCPPQDDGIVSSASFHVPVRFLKGVNQYFWLPAISVETDWGDIGDAVPAPAELGDDISAVVIRAIASHPYFPVPSPPAWRFGGAGEMQTSAELHRWGNATAEPRLLLGVPDCGMAGVSEKLAGTRQLQLPREAALPAPGAAGGRGEGPGPFCSSHVALPGCALLTPFAAPGWKSMGGHLPAGGLQAAPSPRTDELAVEGGLHTLDRLSIPAQMTECNAAGTTLRPVWPGVAEPGRWEGSKQTQDGLAALCSEIPSQWEAQDQARSEPAAACWQPGVRPLLVEPFASDAVSRLYAVQTLGAIRRGVCAWAGRTAIEFGWQTAWTPAMPRFGVMPGTAHPGVAEGAEPSWTAAKAGWLGSLARTTLVPGCEEMHPRPMERLGAPAALRGAIRFVPDRDSCTMAAAGRTGQWAEAQDKPNWARPTVALEMRPAVRLRAQSMAGFEALEARSTLPLTASYGWNSGACLPGAMELDSKVGMARAEAKDIQPGVQGAMHVREEGGWRRPVISPRWSRFHEALAETAMRRSPGWPLGLSPVTVARTALGDEFKLHSGLNLTRGSSSLADVPRLTVRGMDPMANAALNATRLGVQPVPEAGFRSTPDTPQRRIEAVIAPGGARMPHRPPMPMKPTGGMRGETPLHGSSWWQADGVATLLARTDELSRECAPGVAGQIVNGCVVFRPTPVTEWPVFRHVGSGCVAPIGVVAPPAGQLAKVGLAGVRMALQNALPEGARSNVFRDCVVDLMRPALQGASVNRVALVSPGPTRPEFRSGTATGQAIQASYCFTLPPGLPRWTMGLSVGAALRQTGEAPIGQTGIAPHWKPTTCGEMQTRPGICLVGPGEPNMSVLPPLPPCEVIRAPWSQCVLTLEAVWQTPHIGGCFLYKASGTGKVREMEPLRLTHAWNLNQMEIHGEVRPAGLGTATNETRFPRAVIVPAWPRLESPMFPGADMAQIEWQFVWKNTGAKAIGGSARLRGLPRPVAPAIRAWLPPLPIIPPRGPQCGFEAHPGTRRAGRNLDLVQWSGEDEGLLLLSGAWGMLPEKMQHSRGVRILR